MSTDSQPESLHPFSSQDAQIVWDENLGALIRAAYLQSFTPSRVASCRNKFQTFQEWWATLDNERRKRVKGVLAAYIL